MKLTEIVSLWNTKLYGKNLTKEIYDYLETRGIDIDHPRIVATKLGWAEGNLLKDYELHEIPEVLLYKKDQRNPREMFEQSFVLPVINQLDRVTQVTGRVIGDKWENLGMRSPHIHLSMPIQGFLGENLLKSINYIIFVEGFFDFLSLKQHFNNVGGLLGAGGFKESWECKLKNFKIIYTAFDNDKAGNDATKRIARIAKRVGVTVKKVEFEEKDVNDFFSSHTSDDFHNLMRQAKEVRVKRGRPPKINNIENGLSKFHNVLNGTELIRTVKGWKMLCPFHEDSSPSFHLYEDGKAWCFSCCRGWNVVSFLMERDGLTKEEACVQLQE